MRTFIDDAGALANEEHVHLREAEIGFLWTNAENARHGRRIVGTAELGEPQGVSGRWSKARAKLQVQQWFGLVPTFIITIDAHFAAECSDPEFCALIEHELYHCGQGHDIFGAPRFHKDGTPCFELRGHDVEEFVGVVRRYGALGSGVEAIVQAANRGPEIAMAHIAHACGNCLRAAA